MIEDAIMNQHNRHHTTATPYHARCGIELAETPTLRVLLRRYAGLVRDPTTPPGLLRYCYGVLDAIGRELRRRVERKAA